MFQRNDWVVGVLSVLLGAFVIYRSNFWETVTSLDPAGPGALPVILAWGIIIIGIIHLIGFRFSPKSKKYNLQELKPVLQITLVSIIYILLFEKLGYLILTPLLIISIMWIVQVRDKRVLIKTGFLATAVLFAIFFFGLKIKLPLGILEFFFEG